MSRIVFAASLSICLLACGPRTPKFDGGVEEDAGMMEVDAGRQRGDDPATGWQVAVPLPTGAAASARLGPSVTSVGDQFGQPLIAMLFEDPNGDLNYDDNRVVFTRWDGVTKAFSALQTIEVVGGAVSTHPDRQISIARDAVTGRIGIAYTKGQGNVIRLAVSDDEGANFSLSTVSDGTAALVSNPALALKDGVAHVAWLQGSSIEYRKRVGTGAFTPTSPGSIVTGGKPVALALDSAGNPGVAFFLFAGTASAELAFWRPGAPPNVVASADGLDLDNIDRYPSVSLAFVGTTPHLAYHLRKVAPLPMADDTTELWYAKATDATGATWSTPVAIPRNGSATAFHSTRYYQALTIDDSGRVNLAANFAAQGAMTACGGPKLARSTDGAAFTTCSPMGSPMQQGGSWLTMWPHRAGKQTLIFAYETRNNPSIGAGVVMWREP